MRDPAISVCVPAYNQGRFVAAALESVLGQTRGDFELIVYDDASTDDTAAIVASIVDDRIRTFRQRRNSGISATRNACLAVARGRYVAWLDADDVYLPGMLERQSAVLDRHPRVGLVHGAHHVIDENGRRLPDWPAPFDRDAVLPGAEVFRELALSNYVTAPTVLVRRECYERLGGYAQELTRSGEDWEMWLRIALAYDVAYSATPVARYRQHEGSSSTATGRSGERVEFDAAIVDRVFARHRESIPDAPTLLRRARAAQAFKALVRAGDLFTLGRQREALAATVFALRLYPRLLVASEGWLVSTSVLCGAEYAHYRQSKALLARLHRLLEGSWFATKVAKLAAPDAEWEATLRAIAESVRRQVPRGDRVAVVDKCDPTVLHLSRRSGWHFPDRRLLPGGYPEDSERAIAHLEALRRRGARYLIFPNAAFWWLEYYAGLHEHLERTGRRVFGDESCLIYHLPAGT